jgi:hypothetical protein
MMLAMRIAAEALAVQRCAMGVRLPPALSPARKQRGEVDWDSEVGEAGVPEVPKHVHTVIVGGGEPVLGARGGS